MIGYKDAFFDENTHSLCIIMELADNGDLQKKIELAKKRNALIAEEEIWTIALHMLRGLKAMHARNILHRDLKCANVFITKSDDYKIGDLNVSKVAKRGLVYTQTGTPYYASPEVWVSSKRNLRISFFFCLQRECVLFLCNTDWFFIFLSARWAVQQFKRHMVVGLHSLWSCCAESSFPS